MPRFEPAAEEIYYLCAPHGLTATHHDQVNADLLAFIKRNAMQGRRLLDARFSSKDLAHY